MSAAFTERPDGRTASRRPKTVLVVDDHKEICDIVAWYLSAIGFRVLTATNGLGAQQIIRSGTVPEIDLLLTDLEMPDMRGDDLAGCFAKVRPQGRALIMSANGDALSNKEVGGFLQKPFSLDALDCAVRNAFETGSANGVASCNPGDGIPLSEAS